MTTLETTLPDARATAEAPEPLFITPEVYIKTRLDDQIKWMEGKSKFNQWRYKPLKSFEIAAAAAIPLLTGYITEGDQAFYFKLTVGVLGALIAFSSGLSALCRYQELWIEYRGTIEGLQQHKFLFRTKTAPYDGENAFALLVQNVEALLAKENSNWVEATKAAGGKATETTAAAIATFAPAPAAAPPNSPAA